MKNLIKKFISYLEQKLNHLKKYIAIVVLISGITTITVVWFTGSVIPAAYGIDGIISYKTEHLVDVAQAKEVSKNKVKKVKGKRVKVKVNRR
jgi:hypothetical protein